MRPSSFQVSLMRVSLLGIFLVTSFVASVVGCGGGGGDDSSDFSGAATVSLKLTPSQLDSGDRTLVSVEVGDVHPNGIALKFRYPDGLVYVPKSSVLIVDEDGSRISPRVNVASTDGGSTYLVYYLPQKLFRRAKEIYSGEPGTVQFQLVGKSAVTDGLVEVDADVDDANVDNATEFNVAIPEFLAEDQQTISVAVSR
jgi:hypothetical protein